MMRSETLRPRRPLERSHRVFDEVMYRSAMPRGLETRLGEAFEVLRHLRRDYLSGTVPTNRSSTPASWQSIPESGHAALVQRKTRKHLFGLAPLIGQPGRRS